MSLDPAIVTDDEWPQEIAGLRDGFAGQLNVYRMMAHNPALLAGWASLRNHVVLSSSLSPKQSEIVILRTGWRHGSRYEWAHHISRGRRSGLSDEVIAACGGEAVVNDAEATLLIAAVDALIDGSRLDDPLRRELSESIGLKGILDLMATVGMYTTLAFIVETFSIQLDAVIAAELRDDPLLGLATTRSS
jgi:alkylhydroperoxidase family enzyme